MNNERLNDAMELLPQLVNLYPITIMFELLQTERKEDLIEMAISKHKYAFEIGKLITKLDNGELM
jgi:hypothetical protein